MPRIPYEDWKPGPAAIRVLAQADEIARDYAAQGYNLTLRQLYYQFVARGLISNKQTEYKRLGDIINKGRMAGILDWDHVEDRTRNMRQMTRWRDGGHIVDAALNSFHVDHWEGQARRVEVWVEKEALAGVVQQAAEALDCPWFSCRGYVSQSEMWSAGRRFGQIIEGGQGVLVLHLGDHDPSGIDMTRDIRARLRTFISQDWVNAHAERFPDQPVKVSDLFTDMADWCNDKHGGDLYGTDVFEVRRIALNMDQVEEYDPPPNPAKLTDSRAADYVAEYGSESWELDALDPATLDALITDTIEEEIDRDLWGEREAYEDEHRARLQVFRDSYHQEPA